jgi:type I restriction-modification system DNA methylase subunit
VPEANSAEIGFEKQIWDAACILRGNMDAAEYKHVVLGLIFLKYLSDKFDERYQALKAEGDGCPSLKGFEEDRDAYSMKNIFYMPPSARWKKIETKAHTPEIGKCIDDAMIAIERENKILKGVLPKNFAHITLKKHGDSKDILGRTYEFCLGKFAEQEGKLAGEFYTPACVVRTLVEVLQPTLNADFILANPPFNLSDWGADKLQTDVRWKYGVPPAGNANFAWLQHMIHHLNAKGRMGMVLANGSLSSQSGGEGAIRQAIIEDDLVEGIIAMPTQLFYTTQITVSLWFLNKKKAQKGKTLFIDARNMGTMVSRRLREMTDKDIGKIAKTFETFAKGILKAEKGFCAAVPTDEIAKQDYILTPGLFIKSHKLEKEIKKRLGAIGWEI